MHARGNHKIALTALGLAIATFTGTGTAQAGEKIPFAVANVFFELNDTDGDLGIHAEIDGDPWRKIWIHDPGGNRILKVRASGRLQQQGMTQIEFESAEPPFDELDPEDFFERFPKGTYTVRGMTLERKKMRSEDELTHVLPAPPENVEVSGNAAAEDCDAVLPVASTPVLITWDAVTGSHPDLGEAGTLEVLNQQVVVADEETEEISLDVTLPPSATSFLVPSDFTDIIGSGETVKYEILVREASGNRTALESCFVLP